MESAVLYCCFLSLTVHSVLSQQVETTTVTETQQMSTTVTSGEIPFMETLLAGPFKVWHVAGLVGCGIAAIYLRVPRTKEEIEANYEKRQAAHQYIDKLGKMEFTGLKLKSQALMQKELQKKKLEKEENKQKRLEQKKDGVKKPATSQQPNNNFPMGFPMMGGPNGMMGGANGMMGGVNEMMGGANGMMGNMMAYHPGFMMGNPAMYGSLTNLNQPDQQQMMLGPQGMFPKSQSLSNLQTVAEVEKAGPSNADKIQEEGEVDAAGKTPTTGKRFSTLVKGMIQKDASPTNAGKSDTEQITPGGNAKLKAPAKKKWGKK